MQKRIIIIDDDSNVCAVLTNIFNEWGYHAVMYSKSVISSEFMKNECQCSKHHLCADIIMFDINMPDMTGLELIDKLKQNGCKVENFAVMSGAWSDKDMENAGRLGCRAFTKPFHIKNVDDIKDWIDKCNARISPGRQLTESLLCID